MERKWPNALNDHTWPQSFYFILAGWEWNLSCPFSVGRARSDALNELVHEIFEKIHFHTLINTAFIWLSKFSWREKLLIFLIRKSNPLGKAPGGAFRFEEQCHKIQLWVQKDEKGHPGKICETVQLVTAERNAKEFLWNLTHTTYLPQARKFPRLFSFWH